MFSGPPKTGRAIDGWYKNHTSLAMTGPRELAEWTKTIGKDEANKIGRTTRIARVDEVMTDYRAMCDRSVLESIQNRLRLNTGRRDTLGGTSEGAFYLAPEWPRPSAPRTKPDRRHGGLKSHPP